MSLRIKLLLAARFHQRVKANTLDESQEIIQMLRDGLMHNILIQKSRGVRPPRPEVSAQITQKGINFLKREICKARV